MKYLFLLLISLSAFGSNWMPLSKIQSHSTQAYQLESECLKSGEQCLDVGDEPVAVSLGYFNLADIMTDDLDKPLWGSRSMVESCYGEEDCQAKALLKECTDDREAYYNAEYSELWCNKIVGYIQKPSGKKSFSINVSDLSGYKAGLQAQAQVLAIKANGKIAREACLDVLNLIGGFNLLPGRTSSQTDSIVETFTEAKKHLDDGRPGEAKKAILLIPVDGVLVTQAMKDLALEQLKDW